MMIKLSLKGSTVSVLSFPNAEQAEKVNYMRAYHYMIFLAALHQSCRHDLVVQREESLIPNEVAKTIYSSGDSLYFLGDYEEAISYYQQAIVAVEDSSEYQLLSYIISDIGLCYKKMGIYDSALSFYRKAAQIDLANQDSLLLMNHWNNIAIVYKNIGLYSDAVLHLNKSILFIDEKDTLNKARSLASLGGVFLQQDRFEQAFDYYILALDLFTRLGKKKSSARALNNLGLVAEGENKLDSAMYFFRASLFLKAEVDSSLLQSSLHNIGRVFRNKNMLDSSTYHFQLAQELGLKFNHKRDLALDQLELARNMFLMDNISKGKELLDACYTYATETSNSSLIASFLKEYSAYYELINRPQESLRYLRQSVALEDSLFNQEKIKSLDYRYAFETERLEEEKALLSSSAAMEADKARSRFIVIIIMALFSLVLLSALFVILRQRMLMRKLNLELNAYNERIESLNKQNFHFTKNSLSGIVSMLNKQIRRVEGDRVKSVLMEEKLRMESINILYQQLFYTDGADVKVKEFLSGIIQNTIETMLPEQEVTTDLSIDEEIVLNNEKAFNIGLIVNEICINSCKYALKKGKMFFLKWKKSDQETTIFIGDNGENSKEFDLKSSDSFGLQLIRLLIDDMNAIVQTDTANGLEYAIKFES